jgi:hypothetical protein
MKLKASLALSIGLGLAGAAGVAGAGDLVIATVNNGHMIEMQNSRRISRRRTPASKSSG